MTPEELAIIKMQLKNRVNGLNSIIQTTKDRHQLEMDRRGMDQIFEQKYSVDLDAEYFALKNCIIELERMLKLTYINIIREDYMP